MGLHVGTDVLEVGAEDGSNEGAELVGETDGLVDGDEVGVDIGETLVGEIGEFEGSDAGADEDGRSVGDEEGIIVGLVVGVDCTVGNAVKFVVWAPVGTLVGTEVVIVGVAVRGNDGRLVGTADGVAVVGGIVRTALVGFTVGKSD